MNALLMYCNAYYAHVIYRCLMFYEDLLPGDRGQDARATNPRFFQFAGVFPAAHIQR